MDTVVTQGASKSSAAIKRSWLLFQSVNTCVFQLAVPSGLLPSKENRNDKDLSASAVCRYQTWGRVIFLFSCFFSTQHRYTCTYTHRPVHTLSHQLSGLHVIKWFNLSRWDSQWFDHMTDEQHIKNMYITKTSLKINTIAKPQFCLLKLSQHSSKCQVTYLESLICFLFLKSNLNL